MGFSRPVGRTLVFLFAISDIAAAQSLVEAGLGIRGGILTNETFQAHALCVDTACAFVSSSFSADQISGTVGPAVNVLLHERVEVRFEAVRRNFGYQVRSDVFEGPQRSLVLESTKGHLWEYPLLATYRFRSGPIQPFAGGGFGFGTTGAGTTTTQDTTTINQPGVTVSTTTVTRTAAPVPNVIPFYLAAGIDGRVSHVSIRPEFRYSHFPVDQTSGAETLFKVNQFEFLVGMSFQLQIKK